MKKLSFFAFFTLISIFSFAQDITQGTWFNEEKTSRVQFYKQGDKLFGKVVWLKEPNGKDGKPRTDIENPDAKLKTRPLMGLVFMKDFISEEKNIWEEGEIYDPKNGKTYSCKITIVNPKLLEVRGFIGISLIGRTSKFTKAD